MMSDLIRDHAEGIKIPYFPSPTKTEEAEENMCFEPQRREYLDLIHLMNMQALEILLKAPEDMKQHERQYVSDTMTINHQAFTAGLYRKVTL